MTSGALTGRTFFLRASIQLRRMPEVIADRVKTASFVCKREAMETLSAGSCHSLPETPRHRLSQTVDCVREATQVCKGQVEGYSSRPQGNAQPCTSTEIPFLCCLSSHLLLLQQVAKDRIFLGPDPGYRLLL